MLSIFVPESPLWLLQNGYEEDAARAQLVLKGRRTFEGGSENVAAKPQAGIVQNIREIFSNPPVYRAVTVSVMLMVIQQFCGINAIVFYSTSIFESAGI